MVSFFMYLISAKNKINNKFFSQVGHTNNLLKWIKKNDELGRICIKQKIGN